MITPFIYLNLLIAPATGAVSLVRPTVHVSPNTSTRAATPQGPTLARGMHRGATRLTPCGATPEPNMLLLLGGGGLAFGALRRRRSGRSQAPKA